MVSIIFCFTEIFASICISDHSVNNNDYKI